MRIICTEKDDYKMGLALADVARAAGIQTDVVIRQDAYALKIWSIDDIGALKDERAKTMSIADKERFMEFAQRQLLADTTERGWDSLELLMDIFLTDKGKRDKEDM